jgi:hypothetical protein
MHPIPMHIDNTLKLDQRRFTKSVSCLRHTSDWVSMSIEDGGHAGRRLIIVNLVSTASFDGFRPRSDSPLNEGETRSSEPIDAVETFGLFDQLSNTTI